jgi:hypothetical protein
MLVPKAKKNLTQEAKKIPTEINIEDYFVDLDKPVTQEVIFTIQQKIVLCYGSLLVLTGKPKARKTTFLHAFIGAAILNQNIWGIASQMKSDKNLVCLIDTEQSIYDLHQSLGRLQDTINLKLSTTVNFKAYSARSLDLNQLINLIDTICGKNSNLGLLCIDGLLDLVNDINDVREAKSAIQYIKNTADKYNIGIVGILHQNKGTNFSLGHLGSFASRFAQSELSIEKQEDSTSKLSAVFLRSADNINPIEIDFDTTRQIYDVKHNIYSANNYNSIDLIRQIFDGKVGLTHKDLVSRTKIVTFLNNYQVEKKIIPVWYANKLIEKRGNLVQICTVF